MNNNKWSLTESIYVYYSYDDVHVYIANPEAKKYWGPVKKISSSVKEPEFLKNEGFTIKFDPDNIKILLSGKYYVISNLDTVDSWKQLAGASISNGEAKDVVFGFSKENPEKTIFAIQGTDFWKELESEFIRKVNLSIYKKTTKYIPGHKYDSEDGTFWYLGEVIDHRGSRRSSNKYGTKSGDTLGCHAFVNTIPASKSMDQIFQEYRIEDSYTTRLPKNIIDKSIFVVDCKKTMVDLGMDLVVGGKVEDNYEKRLENFMTNNRVSYSIGSNLYYYEGIDSLFSIFNISSDLIVNCSQETKNMAIKIMENELYHILYLTYDLRVNPSGCNISSKSSEKEQIESLINCLFCRVFNSRSHHYYYGNYFTNLFKILFDIELSEVALVSLNDYKQSDVDCIYDFDDLVTHFSHLTYRSPECYKKEIDFIYSNPSKRTFEEFFKNCPYKALIKDIYQEAIDTNGSNLKFFSIHNVGTSKKPILHYDMKITLEDIMNKFGVTDLKDLPDYIKEDIFKLKIYQVEIKSRSDISVRL